MIYLLRKYWKYITIIFCFVLVCIICFISTTKTEKMDVLKKEKKSSNNEKIEKKVDNKSDFKTVFVDVKGAVTTPGVYELEEGKRVIDAITLAGGLNDKADTINLNLSKKLIDEMYIIVYTKNEIYNYKKNNNSSNVSCASVECVCPDKNNDACIKTDSNGDKKTSTENKIVSGKISINTASKEDLMKLSGVGESKADAIINYRKENGNFNSIEDIKNVSGIGDALYEKIKNDITI